MTSPRKTESSAFRPPCVQFLLPKQGHPPSECEDSTGVNLALNRFAIADGATEAFDSGNWARRLTSNWIQANGLLEPDEFWGGWKPKETITTVSWSGLELPWYSREKEQTGSYAAFVGVELLVGREVSQVESHRPR